MDLQLGLFTEGHRVACCEKTSHKAAGPSQVSQFATGDTFETWLDWRKKQSEISCSSNISRLSLIFKESLFPNFSIVTSDCKTIQVHKEVLASCSSYFYALFSSRCLESISNCLQFSDLSKDDLLPILNEIYENDVELCDGNVDNLLVVADRLDIEFLVQKLTNFKAAQINDQNVFKVFQFAKDYNLLGLVEVCKKVICHAIIEFSYRAEFKALSDADLETLLGFEEINCDSELDLVAVICRWAGSDFSGRMVAASWLLFSLRYKYPRKDNFKKSLMGLGSYRSKFTSLIDKFLKIVKDVEEQMDSRLGSAETVDERIVNVLKNHMRCTSMSRSTTCQAPNVLAKKVDPSIQLFSRVSPNSWFEANLQPRYTNELVFLFGGWSGKEPSNMIQVLNPITYHWTVTKMSLPEMRIYYAAAEVDGIVYIIGGFDNNSRGLKSTWAFEPLTGKWTRKHPMFEPRCYASSVVYDGKIIVMGGYDDSQPVSVPYMYSEYQENIPGRRFKSVEMYCPKSDKWSRCCDMAFVRSDAAAVICNGLIYCIGGFTGEIIHNSVEAIHPKALPYNEDRHNWVKIASMRRRRSGVSCEVFNDVIYAVGGYDGESQLDSIEKYDPRYKEWIEIAAMDLPRSNMGLIALNNRLIIVGGYGNDYTTQKCELFDPETRRSQTIEDLPSHEGCSGIKLVVVSGKFDLANMYLCSSEAERIQNNKLMTKNAEDESEKNKRTNM